MSVAAHAEEPGVLLRRALCAFVAAPASPRPLAVFRISLSVVLLALALCCAGNLYDIFGPGGFVQWSIAESSTWSSVPGLSWFTTLLAPFGLDAAATTRAVFFAYILGLALLLLGWRTRLAAFVAWLTQQALQVSGYFSVYGVDHWANAALFYCLLFPISDAFSLDRLAGRTRGGPSPAARLAIRVLQLHLCIAYFCSGVDKAAGPTWWNGEAIWQSLHRPDLAQFNCSWLAQVPWLPMLLGWATITLEIGYPIYVWSRRTRRAWVLGTVCLHLGIAVFLGLWSFSAIMIVFNVAAFLVDPTPAVVPQSLSPPEIS